MYKYVQVFSHINPVPLASASIAQVHSAELRHSGQHVVLKVLKPGVEAVLRTDLNFLYLAVKFLQTLNPELERASIAGIVEDIRTSMLDEVPPLWPLGGFCVFGCYACSRKWLE